MNRIALAALAGGTVSMPTHKFQVGEHVQWNRPYQHITSDIYEIVRQFPETNGEFHYRIKGFHEAHARMATEGELGRLLPAMHELDGADHCCFAPSTPTS